jgi:hypothetical protein
LIKRSLFGEKAQLACTCMYLHIAAYCGGEAAGFRAFMHPVMRVASFCVFLLLSGHSSMLCRKEAQEPQKNRPCFLPQNVKERAPACPAILPGCFSGASRPVFPDTTADTVEKRRGRVGAFGPAGPHTPAPLSRERVTGTTIPPFGGNNSKTAK